MWGWDYASDDEDDADLIKSSTTVDLEIFSIEYDVSVFQLEIRRRLEHFLGDSASETYNATLHNFIRDTSGYRDINRLGEVWSSTERLCWLCMFAEQEGGDEHACRELVLGQTASLTDPDMNSP